MTMDDETEASTCCPEKTGWELMDEAKATVTVLNEDGSQKTMTVGDFATLTDHEHITLFERSNEWLREEREPRWARYFELKEKHELLESTGSATEISMAWDELIQALSSATHYAHSINTLVEAATKAYLTQPGGTVLTTEYDRKTGRFSVQMIRGGPRV